MPETVGSGLMEHLTTQAGTFGEDDGLPQGTTLLSCISAIQEPGIPTGQGKHQALADMSSFVNRVSSNL